MQNQSIPHQDAGELLFVTNWRPVTVLNYHADRHSCIVTQSHKDGWHIAAVRAA